VREGVSACAHLVELAYSIMEKLEHLLFSKARVCVCVGALIKTIPQERLFVHAQTHKYNAHTHAHTHAHACTRTTCTNTYTQMRTHPEKHIRIHIQTHAYTRQFHTLAHAHTQDSEQEPESRRVDFAFVTQTCSRPLSIMAFPCRWRLPCSDRISASTFSFNPLILSIGRTCSWSDMRQRQRSERADLGPTDSASALAG